MLEFKTKLEGVWKTYPADHDVQVKIRPIAKSVIRKLSKKSMITRMEREGGRMVQKEEPDAERLDQLLVDHMVEDWKGITADGEPMVCTPENKLVVMDRYLQLAQWVNDTAFILGEIDDGVKAEKKSD